jgi:DNA (cytosine-5)-methyltransferase 1
MTHLSLFSGIGGLDLAAEWAGFETVGQCEWADYPTKVLEKHWPNVPRWRDVRTLTGESFYERTGLHTVDVISGGFPCQPFSVAGNQKGKEDDRYLWPEMLRVIRELAPRWVIGENVPGILRIAGRTVCEDLEREGYAVTVLNFEAAAVGAPHRRERVFFVGYAEHNGCFAEQELRSNEAAGNEWRQEEQAQAGELAGTGRPFDVPSLRGSESGSKRHDVANTNTARLQRSKKARDPGSSRTHGIEFAAGCSNGEKRWATEPDVGRVANGIPSRVDRLKCLGNAVVPQQAYPIFSVVADIAREAAQ